MERRADETDRRVVRIYLTGKGEALRGEIMRLADKVEASIRELLPAEHLPSFNVVVSHLQKFDLDQG